MYLKKASKVINLEEEGKYEIDGKKYSQKEAIEKILELLEFYLTNITIEKESEAKDALKEASRIWSEIILDMWW